MQVLLSSFLNQMSAGALGLLTFIGLCLGGLLMSALGTLQIFAFHLPRYPQTSLRYTYGSRISVVVWTVALAPWSPLIAGTQYMLQRSSTPYCVHHAFE